MVEQIDPKFLPFIRTDRYGEGGWVVPFWTRVRLIFLACTLVPLRFVACLACVASYYIVCRVVILIPHELVARRLVTVFGKLWSRACLFCLGFVYIRWTRLGEPSRAGKRRSVAVVSNHMSWVDILIHMSRYFPAFVARDGTQNLPMIGLISQRLQCIYVDREKKGQNNNSSSSSAGGSNSNTNSTAAGSDSSTAAAAAAAVGAVAAAAGSAAALPAAAATAAAGLPDQLGVSGQVKQRMLATQQHPELELRPMLLFPEGTTTNGRFLLPFKTGAFLAGVPVLPTIIHYRCGGISSRSRQALAAAGVAACAAAAAATAMTAGAAAGTAGIVAAAVAAVAAVLAAGALFGRGGVSPCWESINAGRHILLMLCQPFHTVECFELPLYRPSPEEQADPKLYAANVRDYMIRHSAAVMGQAALQPSLGVLEDKRRYQRWLKERRQAIEQGRGLGIDVFVDSAGKGGAAGCSTNSNRAVAAPAAAAAAAAAGSNPS